MAATFRSASANSTSDGGSLAVPAPTGVVAGDLLIAVQHTNNASQLANLTAPSGWTAAYSSTTPGSMRVYTRTAASEPSSYTFTGGSSDWSCSILAVQAGTYNTTSPFAVTPVFSTDTTSTTAHVAPSVTGAVGGLHIAVFGACGSANAVRTYTPPSGMTERTDTNSGGWTAQSVTTADLTTTTATGTRTATLTAATPYKAAAFVIAPAPVVTPTNAKLATLTEDGSTWADTSKWSIRSARGVINGSVLELSTAGTTGEYNTWGTDQVWDATGSAFSVKVVTATPAGTSASHATYLTVELNSSNLARIYREGNTLSAGVTTGGTPSNFAIGTYSATDHAWWRIREASGRFYFATSADGTAWVEHATSLPHSWDATDVYAMFMVGRWDPADPAGTASFSRVNLGPAVVETPAVITWREEFTRALSLTQPNGTAGKWRNRGADDTGPVDQGYVEYVAKNWNVSPFQHPDHNPFTVADSMLSISAKRNPGITGVPTSTAQWLSGYLSTEPATSEFGYGYYEIRARVPAGGRGMFPAIWMYNNRIGDNSTDASKAQGEIDLMEVFGEPTGQPWVATAHRKPTPGSQTTIGSFNTDTAGWHRYGLLWTADEVSLYRDGALLASLPAAEAQWFRNLKMSIRLNFAVDPVFAGTPQSTASDPAVGTVMRMDVDYVRVYDKKPPTLATGTADPETPTVDAGADATITLGQTFTRTAQVTNAEAITSRTWDLRTGQSPTVIGGGPTVEWTPTAVGTYVVRHSAIYSGGTAFDEVTVTVTEAPAAPRLFVGGTAITGLYVGATPVTALYVGTQQIWP